MLRLPIVVPILLFSLALAPSTQEQEGQKGTPPGRKIGDVGRFDVDEWVGTLRVSARVSAKLDGAMYRDESYSSILTVRQFFLFRPRRISTEADRLKWRHLGLGRTRTRHDHRHGLRRIP